MDQEAGAGPASDLAPERVPLNEDTAEDVAKQLIQDREWYAVAAQVLAITTSVVLDQISSQGRALLIGLAAIHALLALWARHERTGPFSLGPPWGAIWISATLAMPVLVAYLVAPGDYGSIPACVQMCGYPLGPMVVFALYPWGFSGKQWQRRYIEILTLAAVILWPAAIIFLINGTLNSANIISVGLSGMYVLIMFFGGKEIKRICMAAARTQATILDKAYQDQGELLHGEVAGAARAIDGFVARGEYDQIRPRLDALRKFIREEHNKLTVAQKDVNVLRAVRNAVEMIEPGFEVVKDIPVGVGFVPQQVGELIANATAVLLDNAKAYGRAPAHVVFREESDVLFLEVSDQGDGLLPDTLDNEATALYAVCKRARTLGGDLRVMSAPGEGARLLLFVPKYKPR